MQVPRDSLSRIATLQNKRTVAYNDENDLNPESIRDEIEYIVDSEGYTKVGSGDYRIVYSSNEHVVKIAWNSLGKEENRAEFENWKNIKNTPVESIDGNNRMKARRYLAEVYEDCYDGSNFEWIVMERVKTGSSNVSHDEARRLRQSFSDSGISISEIKPYNIGRKSHDDLERDTIAVFDYGGK